MGALRILRFFTTREGLIALAVLAALAWTQWVRMDAAKDATEDLSQAIAEATQEERARQEEALRKALDEADKARAKDAAEIESLRKLAEEIKRDAKNQVGVEGPCTVPPDLLERLRAIY